MIICDACNKKSTNITTCDECDPYQEDDRHYCPSCIKHKDGQDLCPKCYINRNEQYALYQIINKYVQKSWKALNFGKLEECDHDYTDDKNEIYIEYIVLGLEMKPIKKPNDEVENNIKVRVTAIKDRSDQITNAEYEIENLENFSIKVTVSLLDHDKAIKTLKQQIISSLKSRSDSIKHAKASMLGKMQKQVLEWDNAINFIDNTLKSWGTK